MPRSKKSVPSYLHHKPTNQAYIRLPNGVGGRRVVYLGQYDSPESHNEYRRVLAELQVSGPTAVVPRAAASDLTVNEVLLAFMRWAMTHYQNPDGTPTTEVKELKHSITPVRELYGHTPAVEFGPRALAAVRQKMIGAGLCRSLVNHRVDRVRRVFKWAASEELVPVITHQVLRTLTGLRKGRTEARESKPVLPVDLVHVAATLPLLNRPHRAMVELQQLTGMRPGEVCNLTVGEIDRTGDLWHYRLSQHKTTHHGKERVIPLGPKAQAVLVAFLIGDHPPPEGFEKIDLMDRTARLVAADAYQEANRERDVVLLRDLARPIVFVAGCVIDPTAPLFSPKEGREEWYRSVRANRKSKVQPSQKNRKVKNPKRKPGDRYNPESYGHAVEKAAEKAGVPHWHPNQLRHTFASEIRRRFGLEAAQVLLGHSRADVTQVYAERNHTLAAKVAAEIG